MKSLERKVIDVDDKLFFNLCFLKTEVTHELVKNYGPHSQ